MISAALNVFQGVIGTNLVVVRRMDLKPRLELNEIYISESRRRSFQPRDLYMRAPSEPRLRSKRSACYRAIKVWKVCVGVEFSTEQSGYASSRLVH